MQYVPKEDVFQPGYVSENYNSNINHQLCPLTFNVRV